MDDTCCGDECIFLKNGMCKKVELCPNYTESIWQETQSGKVRVVKDCAPKRTMLCQQQTLNSFDGVTASVQVLRDKVTILEDLLLTVINQSKQYLGEIEDQKQKLEFRSRNEES